MKLSVINKLYEGQMPPQVRAPVCAPNRHKPHSQIGVPPKSGLGEKGVFLVKWVVVCLVGAHTVPRSGG